MGHWHPDDTAKFGLRCDFHPKCFFCSTPLTVFTTGLLDFALDPESQDERSHALDVNFMCSGCGYIDVFGVAINEEHWLKIIDLLKEVVDASEGAYMKDAKYYQQDVNVTEGVNVEKTPKWKRTFNARAHEPKMPVKCFHCGTDMGMRHSTLFFHDDENDRNELNRMAYKCAECGWFVRFNVIDDTQYLKEVHEKYRNGKSLDPKEKKFVRGKSLVPTKEEWSDEDKEKARQLEALGYWGGR